MKYLKLMMIYACRIGLRAFYLVPVKKNRIYLSADRGSGIRCNPLYIYKYLKTKYPGKYEYVWQYDGVSQEKDTTYVKPGTLKDLYFMLTSRVLISNDGFGSFLPKRKSQMFINTWHGGGAYKRSGVDFITDQHTVDLKINQICGRQTDVFLSSSRKFSEVMTTAKMVPKKRFLECGMPRNDLLLAGRKEEILNKVRNYFGIQEGKKIVLFAPTYRGEEQSAKFTSELDTEGCLEALRKRFGGEWVFLMRKHHFVKKAKYDGCINASDYPDMQELLLASDVFITDYSSTIWDYSLMFRPGFLFVPDLEEYSRERNFYTDPETWAFPLAKTNEELQSLICSFDENKNNEKIKEHHKFLGYRETGHAAEIVAKRIEGVL